MSEIDPKEVAIIGLGPGGVSASIYLQRYGMKPVCYEKALVGGKVNETEKIENVAGIKSIKGPELGMLLEDQMGSFDIPVHYEEVKALTLNQDGTFHLVSSKGEKDFKYVILANGLAERPFPIEGEEEFHKRGISRCAICDGPLYKGKDVAVVGAGNAAFEEATYLASICSHVTLIARRKEFRADETVVKKFESLPNTTVYAPYEVIRAAGNSIIESITVRNKETGEQKLIGIAGLFLYVGEIPSTSFLGIEGLADEKGYIITDSDLQTKVKNLYAIGDCRNTPLRQVATATGDGALAATNIHSSYQKGE